MANLTPGSESRDRAASSNKSGDANRVLALDALRGFDMFWLIGGQSFFLAVLTLISEQIRPVPEWLTGQFEHSEWEGFTFWDLIMPLFLFVVGAAMPFSFARRLDVGQTKLQVYSKMIRRFLILFLLGMIVQGHLLDFKFSTLHPFANTLQAIAVGYLVAGVVMLNLGIAGQIAFAALMLIGYWLLFRYVPIAGHGAGSFDPHANVAYAVDKFVLRQFIDGTDPPYTWILSGMTFAATVLLGVFSGHVLRAPYPRFTKFFMLVALGLACLAGGWAWAEWGNFPIIKHLWTSSMTLWAAGWSYLLLALFYLLIDVLGFRAWAFPFVVIGMNAITAYVANFFIPFREIAKSLVGSCELQPNGVEVCKGLQSHLGAAGPLLITFTAVLLPWLVLYYLYRQKIFLRI